MSNANNKGRPAPRRRPASFRARLVGWTERIAPWFAAVLLALVAVWFAFAVYTSVDIIFGATRRTGVLWSKAGLYAAALAGAVFLALVAVRVASPSRFSDGAVRAFATLGLLLAAFSAPLIILRGEYGVTGMVIAVAPLAVYYLRLRRALIDILPPWCGGTFKPEKRRRPRGEDVIKRPPRTWDATSGPDRVADGLATKPRRRQKKKKRRSGR